MRITSPLSAALAAYYAAASAWAEAQARATLSPSPQAALWAQGRKAVLEQARAVFLQTAGATDAI